MEQLRMICKLEKLPQFTLAEGFTLRTYQPGDEQAWTEICKHGLLAENEGIECWEKYILCYSELKPEKDVYFVCDKDNLPVATCTAFVHNEGYGLLHMLGALPRARGNGLALSMTAYALNKLAGELPAGEGLVRLKSDDFRCSAVLAYLRAGFQPVLFDVDMDTRWKNICDKLNFHGVEMLHENGEPTGLIL